jgi:integration host factor alpha subunit
MTKADIARIVYERHGGISNREAARLVEIIFDSIKTRLGGGEKVQITGFGTFVIRQKRERRGRNPQTGEEMVIRPRRSVVFRPSKLFGARRIAAPSRMDPKKIPNKLFFKIGEVCEITDTQPYVLRYWESEFPALAPAKNSSGQRIYRRRDIETVLRIKQLLYDEGFTIAGAKKRLESEMQGRVETPQPTPTGNGGGDGAEREGAGRDDAIKQVREGLREILTLLERNDRSRV